MQLKLAQMEWGLTWGGINGTKWVTGKFLGYPEEKRHCRRPYPKFTDASKKERIAATVKPLMEDEKKLNDSPLLQ